MGSLLQGGRRRRRTSKWFAALAIVLAPLAVAAAAYLALHGRDAQGRTSVPVATHAAHRHAPAIRRHRRRPRPIPVVRLSGVDAFHFGFGKPPRAALLMDVGTGDVLWRQHPFDVMPIASLTKIMTAVLVTQRTRPDDPVKVSRAALHYKGSGVGVLPVWKRVRLETLMNGLLLVSGNDAAIALAVHVAGSQSRFVRLMNRRARQWGLRCTHFVSSHGLEAGNRSCARDLAVLTRMAMASRRIRRIARRSQVSFRFPIKGKRLFLAGHNPLIRAGYRGAIGLKTGFTDEAGRCFVGVARRHGRTLAVVLLNSPNPLKHAAKLLNKGFAHP
jgi:serine-type D-Ala-D-Ala carboxypeptidase (penicillin-binding protein 5/6)